MESANIKVQNIIHGRNNITCSTNCKYRTAAKLCTLETWLVSGFVNTLHKGGDKDEDDDDDDDDDDDNNNNNNIQHVGNINFTLVPRLFHKAHKLLLIFRERQKIPTEKSVNFYQTARCHIPKNRTVFTVHAV
jgi:hypothetical protein